MSSAVECASHAFATHDSLKKASGFKFEDGTCTLGRTPPYIDEILARNAISGGDGVHAFMGKPTSEERAFFEQKVLSCNLLCPVIHLAAEALGNLDLYFLLNEEKIFEPHPILGNPDNDELHQGTRDVEFSLISPVQTFDGMYSTRLMEKACLQVQRKTSKEKIVLKPFPSIFAVHHAPY